MTFNQNQAEDLFFFWKSRVGLFLILKALGIGPGDEVIIPGYTCVVVANAVLYLGARPVYADIDPDTYTISLQTIEPLVTSHTRAIIAQNSFGLSPDYDPILAFADKKGIVVIDDCAHGLGSTYKGRPAGTTTHAAFFSTQWSKPVSTGLGGIVLVRDAALAQKLSLQCSSIPAPSILEQVVLLSQVLVRPLADNPALYYRLMDLYRLLTQKAGLSIGSSVGDELTTTNMPHGYLKRMGAFQKMGWERGLKTIQKKTIRRHRVAQFYDSFLGGKDISIPFRPAYAEHGMLRYVVRVNNKEEVLEKARVNQIPMGDWFVSPLHPVVTQLEKWHYKRGQCPEAETACRETVNLFTDRALKLEQLNILFDHKVEAGIKIE